MKEMGDVIAPPPDMVDRQSVCFACPRPGMLVHSGDPGFTDTLRRLYRPAESNAAEALVKLKHVLRDADAESFWHLLTEGLANIAGAQYAFVSKRILRDDRDVAVEMPPIGEPGACLMGAAFYINDGRNINTHMSNFKYHAYQCPCAYMRHDKIFIIPEKLNDFIINNPNELVVPGEAYLGIPLFAEGKCFAHFGVMWSPEGAAKRQLGWAYLEMLFHALEDLILDRVLRGEDFANSADVGTPLSPNVVPHEAISMAQSLKPYARSLSHELRTPMQGVVGMLDVMMADVKEAAEDAHYQPRIKSLLESLRANIETVQDSSRRAVEAADNVVHAYDMNMGMPETPSSPLDKTAPYDHLDRSIQLEIPVTGDTLPLDQYRGTKRKAAEIASWSKKVRVARSARQRVRSSVPEDPTARKQTSATLKPRTRIDTMDTTCSHGASSAPCDNDSTASPMFASEHSTAPGLRHTSLRDVVQYVINDALKVGGRPESAVASETDLGESIEVHARSSSGQATAKYIEWAVARDVPDTILIDEKDLAKMISCVTLNAIKFTENGKITLKATLSPNSCYIVINVKDSGSGIPAAFLPNLFKPFSREDDSTTRQNEGLGLGLMVAKGLARKLGGDLFCLRSNVSGPDKGTEFEMRVPLAPGEVCSRPSTPFGSPSPSFKSRVSTEREVAALHMEQQPITPPMSTEYKGLDSSLVAKLAPTLDRLTLPSSRSASPARGRGASKNRSFSNNDFDKQLACSHPANILIVDDNRINRHVLRHMLKNLGYTKVYEAYDGNDAVQKMMANAEGPAHEVINLVLMDLWMPLLDGFQATEKILSMALLAEKPTILAVSADVTDAAVARAGRVGMKGFLTKPFIIRDVEKLILQHCQAVDITSGSSS